MRKNVIKNIYYTKDNMQMLRLPSPDHIHIHLLYTQCYYCATADRSKAKKLRW